MNKENYVNKMWDLMEMLGERDILMEYVIYSTLDELKEFVEHCETVFEVETE